MSEFHLFTSFQWLLSLKLKVASDFPVYCLLHNTHSIRYIRHLLLQLSLWYILIVLCVTALLKVFVDCTYVQHRFFNLGAAGLQITILINILTWLFSIVDVFFLLFLFLFFLQKYPAGLCFIWRLIIGRRLL